jgi:transcriptional regulator with PAS, ATPase and Fis domain
MTELELLDRLRKAPALSRLPLLELADLAARAEVRGFSPGEVLLKEGAVAPHVHLLLDGRVAILKSTEEGESRKIATRTETDWLGEAGALDAQPSSASVIAESAVRTLAVPREVFLEVVRRDVDGVLDLLRSVTRRLRESDNELIRALSNEVRALRSQNRDLSSENRRLHAALDERHGFEAFVGSSPAAQAVRATARQAAESDLPVLIVGETGTGKELLARAIHLGSGRCGRPFVALNCALLTAPLLESELFGHARGAFTGATQSKRGLVEAADGGTLFLDEVADTPAPLQGALLRFLELGEFRRVGETGIRKADVRVIAASQRPLDEAVRERAFRLDLLYRLDVMQVRIPPLRERRQDVPFLVAHCLERIARRKDVAPLLLEPEAIEALCRHDFPGNVRELENEMERLYAFMKPGSSVPASVLSRRVTAAAASTSRYSEALREFKARTIEQALREAGGNRTRAAERLGVHRSNLVRMIRELGIEGGAALTRPLPGPAGRS